MQENHEFLTTQPAQNQPKSQILLNKNISPCDLYTMTLVSGGFDMEIKEEWNQLEENHEEIEIIANEDSIINCLIPINNSIIIEPFENSGDPLAL